jgi:hypothetical protein
MGPAGASRYFHNVISVVNGNCGIRNLEEEVPKLAFRVASLKSNPRAVKSSSANAFLRIHAK